ncbi:glycosyltransferase family 4 protein [bacterium]|nr:glycosyltransferase family 4 protein [bacterium]
MRKKSLLIVCPYPFDVAPSQRLKFEQYFAAFKEDGWSIEFEPFMSPRFWSIVYSPGRLLEKAWLCLVGYVRRWLLLSRVSQYHTVYVHLWATPFGPPFYERLLRKLARRLIYDIDDLVYIRNDSSFTHPLVGFLKGRQKPIYLMKVADHVITCTPYLDEFVRQRNPHTTDISSTVDLDRYHLTSLSVRSPLTIGWSGSLSTSRYFYLLAPVLRRLRHNHNFRLLVMGDDSVRIEGLEIEAVAWSENLEMPTLQRFDIGVYPLPDEEWVYGKSGLKAIQYMALGIPTVAAAIGTNFRVIEHEQSGLLARTEDDWYRALDSLLSDPDLRTRLGQGGRDKVEKVYSVQANAMNYLKILNAQPGDHDFS